MKFKLLIAAVSLMMGVQASAVAGDATAGQAKAAMCIACHMVDGNSVVPLFPKLAGQHEQYIVKQLQEFKAMKRKDDTMFGMSAALMDQDMADIGAYYSAQKVTAPAAVDAAKAAKGKDIYRGGNMVTGVPACMGCHGPALAGNPTAKYPQLAGQHVAYTIKQLKAFRDGLRDNDPGKMMSNVVIRMNDAEIEAVAHYIGSMQ